MKRTPFAKSVARRSVLSAVGAGLAGLLIRPLQAQEALGPPKRLLIVHRPCGTVLDRFFPELGPPRNFVFPEITKPFEPLRDDLVLLDGVTNPRDQGWAGDQHAAGLICLMSGKRFGFMPGTDAGGDPNAKNLIAVDATIDQYLAANAPALKGNVLGSIQSTAYLQSTGGLPSFKVMSYKGNNQPLFPTNDAAALFQTLFGQRSAQDLTGLGDDKSVLDCVSADLARLQDLIPASQKDKLAAHLSSIQSLKDGLNGMEPQAACFPPTQLALPLPSDGQSPEEAKHLALSQNQLAIIRTAFQCDLTRVATFTFAHGNSDLRFKTMVEGVDKGDGHHGISHDTSAVNAQARIDQVYCEQLVQCLLQMKATPEGKGTLLDNTLVVFLSECAVGNTHSIQNTPLVMIGGKNLGLQAGQHLNFNGRYMNDVWAALCGVFGLDAKFGDPLFGSGPVTQLFG